MGIKLVKQFTQTFCVKMGKVQTYFCIGNDSVLIFFMVLFCFILLRGKGGVPLPHQCHSRKAKIHYFVPDTNVLNGILRKHQTGL